MTKAEEYDVLILGSGTGGKLMAWHMARAGKRTAVVERRWIGGSCPNIACMPSKNEIWSARAVHLARRNVVLGARAETVGTDMVDWSYDYLSEAERAVLRRLSVFAGAFTLDSAIAVAGGKDAGVVEGIADLVAKSLIVAEAGDLLVRYRMLETTRVYAMHKLVESGEAGEYSRRHALHYRKTIERAEDDWRSLTTAQWLERYDCNIDDVRSALK